jgi:hypothetical protein
MVGHMQVQPRAAFMLGCLVGVAFLGVPATVAISAQPQTGPAQPGATVTLAGQTLALGMAETDVLKGFQDYWLPILTTKGKGPYSSWMIRSRNGPPYEVAGSISCREGRLVYVAKSWTPQTSQQAFAFADAVFLFWTISGFVRDGYRACVLDTRNVDEPGSQVRTVSILCGGKRIEVSALRIAGSGEFAGVDEILEAPR